MNRRRFLIALATLAAIPAGLAAAKGVQAKPLVSWDHVDLGLAHNWRDGQAVYVRDDGKVACTCHGAVRDTADAGEAYGRGYNDGLDAAALRADQERRAAEDAGRAFPDGAPGLSGETAPIYGVAFSDTAPRVRGLTADDTRRLWSRASAEHDAWRLALHEGA